VPDPRPGPLSLAHPSRRLRRSTLAIALAAGLAASLPACSAGPDRFQTLEVAGRPVAVQLPSGYDGENPVPLVLALHGFGSSSKTLDESFHLSDVVDELGFLYLRPEGTLDCEGRSFWDATEVCCDFCGVDVDDSGYLRDVIAEARRRFAVDADRVYVVGHSNGGFMAQRLACDHAELIAGVASLAGAGAMDPSTCTPSEPVHWLQIHGTADERIRYRGGIVRGRVYPGARTTARRWAEIAGCSPGAQPGDEALDLVEDLDGAETRVLRYEQGCAPGGSATLWTIEGGVHAPLLTRDFGRRVVSYLLAHPKRPTAPALD